MTRGREVPAGSETRRLLLRRAGMLALAVAVVLCFAGIFQHGLWAPDEPREAEIGREMLLSKWSPTPTLGGEPFLEKPPLFAWAMAACYALFGVNAGVARLPAALFSVGAVWTAYLLARRAGGRLAGLCAAVVLVTAGEFAGASHRALIDTALTFFVGAGHLAFLRARDGAGARRDAKWLVVAGACAGLAFLTKGVVGPALVAGPPLLAAAVLREWAFLRRAAPRAALACGAAVLLLAGPWVFALAHAAGWPAVSECLVKNTIARTMGGSTEDVGFLVHGNPPWYYLAVFPVTLLPWALAVPALVVGGTSAKSWRAGRTRFLAVTVVCGVALLSLPAGKRSLYLVPLLPAAAAALGVWLSRVGSRRGGRWDARTLTILLAAVCATLLVIGYVLLGGPVPAGKTKLKIDVLTSHYGVAAAVVGAACAAAGAAAAWAAARARATAADARTTALVVLAAVAVGHAVARPLLDGPCMGLRAGALEVGSLVPPDEPLLSLAPDETTRAVVEFYTGRAVRRVAGAGQAAAELRAGAARHLIVPESSEAGLKPRLRERLTLVASVRMNWDRRVNVYRWNGP